MIHLNFAAWVSQVCMNFWEPLSRVPKSPWVWARLGNAPLRLDGIMFSENESSPGTTEKDPSFPSVNIQAFQLSEKNSHDE